MISDVDYDSLSIEELKKRKATLEQDIANAPKEDTRALDAPNTTGRDVINYGAGVAGAAAGATSGLLNRPNMRNYELGVQESNAALQTAKTAEDVAAHARNNLPPQPARPSVTVTGLPPDYVPPATPIPRHPGFADRPDIAPPNPRNIPQPPGATNVSSIQPFVGAPAVRPPVLLPEAPISIPGQETPPPPSTFNERGTSGDRWNRKVMGSLGPGGASSTEAARHTNLERSLDPTERAQFSVSREGIIVPNTTEETMARIRQNELEGNHAGNREANTDAQRKYANERTFAQDMQQRRQAQLTNDLRLGQGQNQESRQNFHDSLKREDQVLKQKFSIYNALQAEALAEEKRINDLYNARIKAAGLDTNRSSQEYKALESKWKNELAAAKQTFDQKVALLRIDESSYKDAVKRAQDLEDAATKARSAATAATQKASGLKVLAQPLTAAYEGSRLQQGIGKLGSGLDALATGATRVLDSTPGRIVGGALSGYGAASNAQQAADAYRKGNTARAALHGVNSFGNLLTISRNPAAFIPGLGLSLASEAALWGLNKFSPQTQ